ncbi:MAG TPA: hypothetical protein VJV78_45240 [Polyangiales bacterium]|nr:hypothetical protein [Polyangiales bacterium]
MSKRGLGLLGGLALLLGLAESVMADPPPSAAPVSCVDVSQDAPYAGLGYDHIVKLTNNCKKPVSCSVKTDVNPKAQQVNLAVGEKKSIVTWRGSPAYAFTPDVTCQ